MNHVVMMMSDQHSAHALGCYGNAEVKTPVLDALAARGARFAHAYTTSPVCVPARFSALSGLYPSHTGCVNNATPLPIDVMTAAHYFRAAGYLTAFIGKMHPVDAQTHGFDYYIDFGHYYDYLGRKLEIFTKGMQADDSGKGVPWVEVYQNPEHHWSLSPLRDGQAGNLPEEDHFESFVVREALRFFRQYAHRRPIFLFVSFLRPHTPLIVPERFAQRYQAERMTLPATWNAPANGLNPYLRARRVAGLETEARQVQAREHLARYYAAVSFVDAKVGELLAGLEAISPQSPPVVGYTSDHGDMLFEHGMLSKFTFYEASVTVPWILAGPGIVPGQTVAEPVDHTSWLPTWMDYAGVAPTALDGFSVRAHLEELGPPAHPVFSEFFIGQDKTMHMVRLGAWKLIRHPDGLRQLFQVDDDPEERINLADQQLAEARRLEALLDEHLEQLQTAGLNLRGPNPRV